MRFGLKIVGIFLALLALLSYFYQIYIIYDTRVRMERDIYFRSMVVSYIAFVLSLVLALLYGLFAIPSLLMTTFWSLFFGFVSMLIIGHLYKIVPFLVWYQRFAPLVGKQTVPMLADILPKRSANHPVYLYNSWYAFRLFWPFI